MIYLKRTTEVQQMYVPKGMRNAIGIVSFKAYSSVNLTGFVFDVAVDDTSLLYHKMLVELKDNIPAGEYEYTLSDEMGDLSTGILVIGELDEHVEFVTEAEYEQYEE